MNTAERLLVRGTEGRCFEHQVKEARNHNEDKLVNYSVTSSLVGPICYSILCI